MFRSLDVEVADLSNFQTFKFPNFDILEHANADVCKVTAET